MYVNKHAWSNSHINQIKSAEQNRGNERYERYETRLYGGGSSGTKEVSSWQIELENCSTDLFIAADSSHKATGCKLLIY